MTRDQLEHAIHAACEVTGDSEVWVFGSQAILGEYPDAPETLRASIEVDMMPKNRPEKYDDINGALGELSQFHETHHFYVHGLQIKRGNFPDGWEKRAVPVSEPLQGRTGLCLEKHDLATAKLLANRDKDRAFVRTLLKEHMIDAKTLVTRIGRLSAGEMVKASMVEWVRMTNSALF